MTTDALGHTVTTECAATVAAIDVYTADWIGYGTRLRTIFEAADADPECALVNAQAAAVHMALEAASGFANARPYLKRARANARWATENEQIFVAAILAWSNGDTAKALAQLRKLVRAQPTDIGAAKWGQYHAFNLGDAQAMRALAETIMPAHKNTPEAWGMLAFGLEQCHELGAAEEAGRRAISLKRGEPWAHHALAHVMDTQGRIDEGIDFMTWHAHTWTNRSIFVREHNYWHLALLHLDRDEPKKALQIFD
jgi:tetratricopeptide (TPR) repeat protein